jgi:hypothetical protein
MKMPASVELTPYDQGNWESPHQPMVNYSTPIPLFLYILCFSKSRKNLTFAGS